MVEGGWGGGVHVCCSLFVFFIFVYDLKIVITYTDTVLPHQMGFCLFQTDLNVTGDLSVTLNFQMPSTLFVTVHGAQGLSPCSGRQSADPFVKVAIPGVGAVHSSQVG